MRTPSLDLKYRNSLHRQVPLHPPDVSEMIIVYNETIRLIILFHVGTVPEPVKSELQGVNLPTLLPCSIYPFTYPLPCDFVQVRTRLRLCGCRTLLKCLHRYQVVPLNAI